jgi:hypothetical protein
MATFKFRFTTATPDVTCARWLVIAATVCVAAPLIQGAEPKPGTGEMPLVYDGPGLTDPNAPDGKMPLSPGVQNVEIFRANRGKPCGLFQNEPGWTYHHHMDLACWHGKLYAAWVMTPRDEDVPPFRVVFATSSDGFNWSEPKPLFPPNEGWATRFYFYRTSKDRLLAFATGPYDTKNLSEKEKGTLLVRELGADDRLSDLYTLVKPGPKSPPPFEKATDQDFVAACREACNCKLLLEQQDYGVFLGDRRMKWHDAANWPGGKVQGRDNYWTFGKAFCFFHRGDGALVGVCKLGFVTQSMDEGETWSFPVVAKGLTVGGAKEWAQRTPDGRYAMVYPPQGPRYPMVVTASEDGITFRNMRVVHGEVPPQRYQGRYKDMGPQYLRGIPEFSGDARSFDPSAIWVIYSVNKEDIWVSRIPVPILPQATEPVHDTFENAKPGLRVPGWNVYSPKWAQVRVEKEGRGNQWLQLEDRDPVDYARATRTFPPSTAGEVSFRLAAEQKDRGRLEVELLGNAGTRPVRIVLNDAGQVLVANGSMLSKVAEYRPKNWASFSIKVNQGKFTLLRDRKVIVKDADFAEPASSIYAISFRTGEFLGTVPKAAERDVPNTEDPAPACVYKVDDVITANLQICQ